jgi:hypothetical protein
MRSIRNVLGEKLKNYITVPEPQEMRIGHPDGITVYVDQARQPMTVWCTDRFGIPQKVLDRKSRKRWGDMVKVGYNPWDLSKREQVLGYADSYISADWMGPDVPAHAKEAHDWGKWDCDWVKQERILYFVPVAGENKFDIYPPNTKYLSGSNSWWSKRVPVRVDYESQIPATGASICIVVLDDTGAIDFRNGTPIDNIDDLSEADYPPLEAGDAGIVALRLTAGMMEAHHAPGDDTFDNLGFSGAYAGTTSAITGLTTDVNAVGPGLAVATIQPGVVTNSKLADMAGATIKGRQTGTGSPEDLTLAQLLAMGAGVFGGAIENLTSQVTGSQTHFTFTNAASAIWVLVRGVWQKSEDITFSPDSTSFDLAWPPSAGSDLRVVRLAPTVSPVVYPSIYFLPIYLTSTNVNWDTIAIAAAADYYLLSSGLQNDEVTWTMALPPGTYTWSLTHFSGTNRGIYHLYIDGTPIGTIDGSVSPGFVTRSKITGIAVTGGSAVVLKIKMETSSNSDYYGTIFETLLKRTGA